METDFLVENPSTRGFACLSAQLRNQTPRLKRAHWHRRSDRDIAEGVHVSNAAKSRPSIRRDAASYMVVFCGAWVVFLGAFMALEGGAVGDYVDLFLGLLLIGGLPSLLLVIVARLLARKGDFGAFTAACGTLLLLPAVVPLLMGAWPATLVQMGALIAFLGWRAWPKLCE
ncbi:hypothetical protein ACFT25_16025 [Streptomyces hydrogenans]|uniref:hypothetical protein n=1 Tax=Streptomyces hydrogenans TaxID=1873719 RepID=UPI0036279BC8